MTPANTPVKLIFIASMGRSGSTLLDRLLGGIEGWWSMGEVVHLWERGLAEDERCSCGDRFSKCPFWLEVGEVGFGGWNNVDVDGIRRLQRSVERDRYLPLLLRPTISSSFQSRLVQYQDVLGLLYRAVQQVSGTSVLVDSGKHVSAALALRTNRHVDLTLVHLVRDSRGVAFSWSKVQTRPETDHRQLMAQWGPTEVALRYDSYNLLLDSLDPTTAPTFRVRYEDLVRSPRETLSPVLSAVGGDPSELRTDPEGNADLGPGHMIGGNPMRFSRGAVPMSLDEKWRSALAASPRRLVTALTYPLLRRYGYAAGPPLWQPRLLSRRT